MLVEEGKFPGTMQIRQIDGEQSCKRFVPWFMVQVAIEAAGCAALAREAALRVLGSELQRGWWVKCWVAYIHHLLLLQGIRLVR